MAVHLVQALCPRRHCLIAVAYNASEHTEASAIARCRRTWLDLVETGTLNPWCDLCGSAEVHYEDGATPFATLAEAMPALARLEDEQRLANLVLKARAGRPGDN